MFQVSSCHAWHWFQDFIWWCMFTINFMRIRTWLRNYLQNLFLLSYLESFFPSLFVILVFAGKPSCTSHGSARLSATSMRSASTSSSWSEWSFGFFWSQVVKFRIFCLWVLLIDAFLVNLWSFGCLSWYVIVGFCLIDVFFSWRLAKNEGAGSFGFYFTTSREMKASAKVVDRRELKIRERREMWEKRYSFGIYYFIM